MLPVAHPSRARVRRPRVLVACAWLAVLALGVACAGGPRASGSPPLRRVFLLPLNVVVTLPTEVESGVDLVAAELRATLEAHGLAVESMPLSEAREQWLQSAVALKATVGPDGMSFEGAGGMLARRLHETRDFDVLIVPWIAMREARMQGSTISWDGVRRKLRPADPTARPPSFLLGRFRGTVVAPSLQVVVFSPSGEKRFEGVGGLDLVHDVDLELVTATKYDVQMAPRSVIFQERDLLHEGIAIALDPLLPPLAETAE